MCYMILKDCCFCLHVPVLRNIILTHIIMQQVIA